MKVSEQSRKLLSRLVAQFMAQMHRYDSGRTLAVLHGSRLTTPQIAVLEFVRTARTVSDVAEYLGLSLPASSQMVQKLVERGYIVRSESAADRRERKLALAAGGVVLLELIAAARAARFEASLAALPDSVATRLEAALAATIEALDRASSATAPAKGPKR